jgi:hypothetical protein
MGPSQHQPPTNSPILHIPPPPQEGGTDACCVPREEEGGGGGVDGRRYASHILTVHPTPSLYGEVQEFLCLLSLEGAVFQNRINSVSFIVFFLSL